MYEDSPDKDEQLKELCEYANLKLGPIFREALKSLIEEEPEDGLTVCYIVFIYIYMIIYIVIIYIQHAVFY